MSIALLLASGFLLSACGGGTSGAGIATVPATPSPSASPSVAGVDPEVLACLDDARAITDAVHAVRLAASDFSQSARDGAAVDVYVGAVEKARSTLAKAKIGTTLRSEKKDVLDGIDELVDGLHAGSSQAKEGLDLVEKAYTKVSTVGVCD